MKNTFAILLLAFVMYGCSREVPCSDATLQAGFVGFVKTDFDTVILRKYKPKDNYQHLVDTILFINDSSSLFQKKDTIFLNGAYYSYGIKAGNDWQIYLPKKHTLVSVSNIKTDQSSINCHVTIGKPDCNCINQIYSVKVDSTTLDLSNIAPHYYAYTIVIH